MKRRTGNLIAKWKGTFSKGEVKTAETKNMAKQAEGQPNVPALTLIKKDTASFQLSRMRNPKDFEIMNFVVKAILKTAEVSSKTVLHVERSKTGSRLVACDGSRLHFAEISMKIKSGNYKPHVTKDTITLGDPIEGISFPSWANAIPENAEKRGVINLKESGLGKNRRETDRLSIAFHTLTKETGETVNVRFLEDLTKREWAIYKQEGRRAIILRQKTGRIGDTEYKGPVAIIMPVAEAA
jgi:hypothetical protein